MVVFKLEFIGFKGMSRNVMLWPGVYIPGLGEIWVKCGERENKNLELLNCAVSNAQDVSTVPKK